MFLLGDNRNMSSDSRDYGDYPLNSLVVAVEHINTLNFVHCVEDFFVLLPQWSIDGKAFTTAVYTFFNFTLLGK